MYKEKVFLMSVGKGYLSLVAKTEREGQSKTEVDEVICWLIRYTTEQLNQQIEKDVTYETFFAGAPQMNPILSRCLTPMVGMDQNTPIIEVTKKLTNKEKTSENPGTQGNPGSNPKTGYETNLWLPIVLMLAEGGMVAGILFWKQKEEKTE